MAQNSDINNDKDKIQKILRRYYEKNLVKGVALRSNELLSYARKRKLGHPGKKFIETLPLEYKAVALRRKYRKPIQYAGASIEKYGNLFIDHAIFKPTWSKFNSSIKGFIAASEGLTGVIQIYLVKDKSFDSYKKAILSFIDYYENGIHTIISDREPSLTGRFYSENLDQKNIKIKFSRGHAKSYKSERCILYVKNRLSLALDAKLELSKRKARQEGRKLTKVERLKLRRWIDFVPDIVLDYNRRNIPGTKLKRGLIRRQDFTTAIESIYRTKTPWNLLSMGTNDFMPAAWKDLFFKFKLGAKVLIAWKAYYKVKSTFHKSSIVGNYHSKIFKIYKRLVKTNRKSYIVPAYKLIDPAHGSGEVLESIFYANELVPVLYLKQDEKSSDSEDSSTIDESGAGD